MISENTIYERREKDFRVGAVVYQILVDRFARRDEFEAKKSLYQYPKKLHQWHELPLPGHFMPDVKYWSHELDYFGGDFKGLMSKLDYIDQLHVDVVYLNPIFDSLSNHKYDASDYLKISIEYGTMEELSELSYSLHQRGKKIMLDGVFNHVGVSSPLFQQAQNPQSSYRDWFYFGSQYPEGVRLWADAKSLPELNLENEAVKDYIYRSPDSVIRSYLRAGIDGWRLDVAFDIGYDILRDLTDHAHLEKPGSMIVGETWNYPTRWLDAMDGVMNFTLREIIFHAIAGDFCAVRTNKLLDQLVRESGIEGLLKSWIVLDNHDTVRLNHRLPQVVDQKLAQVLQFTLPGAPNLYYGTELGMEGAGDPQNRAPMRWDLCTVDNPTLQWTQSLIDMHQQQRALKVGDYRYIDTTELIAFERYTDRVEDTVIVVVNASDNEVHDYLVIADSSLMNFSQFKVLLGSARNLTLIAGLLDITLASKSFVVLSPNTHPQKSYTPYKRV